MIEQHPWILSLMVCAGMYLMASNKYTALAGMAAIALASLGSMALGLYLTWSAAEAPLITQICNTIILVTLGIAFTLPAIASFAWIGDGLTGPRKPDGTPYTTGETAMAFGGQGLLMGGAFLIMGLASQEIQPWNWVMNYSMLGLALTCLPPGAYFTYQILRHKELLYETKDRSGEAEGVPAYPHWPGKAGWNCPGFPVDFSRRVDRNRAAGRPFLDGLQPHPAHAQPPHAHRRPAQPKRRA